MKHLTRSITAMLKLTIYSTVAIALLSKIALAQTTYSSFAHTVKGQGHDIILIPGLMSDGRVWEATSAVLSEEYRVHTISIAGFGITSTQRTNTINDVEAELIEYISTLEKPTIIGHSIGGLLAMSLAIKKPDSINHVISVDGLPFIGPVFTRNANTQVSDISAQANFIRDHYAKLRKKQLRAEVSRGIDIQATATDTKKMIIDMSSLSDATTVGEMMYSVMTTDLRPSLAQIKADVLLLGASGAMPNDAGKDQIERLYASQFRTLPSAQIKINRRARHFIMLDDLDWFLQQVNDFLEAE